MAAKPSFGALKKAKPALEVVTPGDAAPREVDSIRVTRIQTSVRLDPAMWAALSALATRKTVESGRKVSVHDLLIEGVSHILAVNGVGVSR